MENYFENNNIDIVVVIIIIPEDIEESKYSSLFSSIINRIVSLEYFINARPTGRDKDKVTGAKVIVSRLIWSCLPSDILSPCPPLARAHTRSSATRSILVCQYKFGTPACVMFIY